MTSRCRVLIGSEETSRCPFNPPLLFSVSSSFYAFLTRQLHASKHVEYSRANAVSLSYLAYQPTFLIFSTRRFHLCGPPRPIFPSLISHRRFRHVSYQCITPRFPVFFATFLHLGLLFRVIITTEYWNMGSLNHNQTAMGPVRNASLPLISNRPLSRTSICTSGPKSDAPLGPYSSALETMTPYSLALQFI